MQSAITQQCDHIYKGLGKPVKHSVKYYIKMFDDV